MKPSNEIKPDITSASPSDTLAALRVNADTGLTQAEVDTRRAEHGYNEVAVQKEHPVLKFLGKFWGLSAWMLELIMILSLWLNSWADLAIVGALLVVNAVLGFWQERRAAGVMEHEDVIGGDVNETAEGAPLGEIDLLAVAGREGEVEVADEIERLTADVHAVSDRGWQRRVVTA